MTAHTLRRVWNPLSMKKETPLLRTLEADMVPLPQAGPGLQHSILSNPFATSMTFF